MNAIVAGARTPSDTLSTALLLAAPSERRRPSLCTWWLNHTLSRVPVPTWSSRRSRSCTCRASWARLRDARSRRKWKTLLNHAVIPARARRGWPVSRSPTASTIETMNPNGTSHSSVPSEYEVSSTRTRLRADRDVVGAVGASALLGRFAVRDARVGHDQHAGTDEPGPPTEVEVLGAGERRGIEPSERGEEVDAHEHRGGRDVEDVAHTVVLLLIELPGLDPGVRRAEAVDGPADVEQHARVVGGDELGPDDPCVRAVRLLHQRAHDVRRRARRRRGRRGGTWPPRLRAAPRWPPRRTPRSRAAAGRRRPAAARRPSRWDRPGCRSRRRAP